MRVSGLSMALHAAAALLCGATVAVAGDVGRTFGFGLDHWYDLGAKDGPVTLKRVRLVKQTGVFTKSSLFRPGNTTYLATVQLQIEYSNTGKGDWKAHLDVAWVDSDDVPIDGYKGSEGLDGDTGDGKVTVTLSTLEYGLAKARKLKVGIRTEPD